MPTELDGRTHALRAVVGTAAIIAPLLHSLTDVMEWYQDGFSPAQLWLNYLAFLPMSWLLLGIYAVARRNMGVAGLVGALFYGIAFTYFAHTTLDALSSHAADYESLWNRLGRTYTVHGVFMIAGGLMFSAAAYRARALPRLATAMFAAGLCINLLLGLLPAPDILQTIGTAIRNAGLISMGVALWSERPVDS